MTKLATAVVGVLGFLPGGRALAIHGMPGMPVAVGRPGLEAMEVAIGGDRDGDGRVGAAWPVAEEVCGSTDCPHYEEAGGGDGYALRYYVGDAASVVAVLKAPGLDAGRAIGLGLQQAVAYAAGLNGAGRPVALGAPLTLVVVSSRGPRDDEEDLGRPPHPAWDDMETFLVSAPLAYAEAAPAPSLTPAQFNMKVVQAADATGHCVAVAKRTGAMDADEGRAAFEALAAALKADGISGPDVFWETPFVMAYGGEGADAVLELGWPLTASSCGKKAQGTEGASSPLLLHDVVDILST